MLNVWGHAPKEFQANFISNQMKQFSTSNIGDIVLVQCSGNRKSIVYRILGNILCGITAVVQLTLALSADQNERIKYTTISTYPIVSFKCDSIESSKLFEAFVYAIANVEKASTSNIYRFIRITLNFINDKMDYIVENTYDK